MAADVIDWVLTAAAAAAAVVCGLVVFDTFVDVLSCILFLSLSSLLSVDFRLICISHSFPCATLSKVVCCCVV